MKIIIHSYNTQHIEPSVRATIFADSCPTYGWTLGMTSP